MDLHSIIKRVMPSFADIRKDVALLQRANPGKGPSALASVYLKGIRKKYTSVGVVSALPGVIPGLGTIAQVAIEAGSISADVLLMLRFMAALSYGTGIIYGRDTEQEFEDTFTVVLGIWAEVIVPQKAAIALGEKITAGHFDQHITARIKNRMNQKIGRKMVTKYGSKRGGVAIGTLIPFGIGAAVGGYFNYTTIDRFGKAADDYFSREGQSYTVTE